MTELWVALVWVCSQAITSLNVCEGVERKEAVTHVQCQGVVRETVEALRQAGAYPPLPGPWVIHGQCAKEEAYVPLERKELSSGTR